MARFIYVSIAVLFAFVMSTAQASTLIDFESTPSGSVGSSVTIDGFTFMTINPAGLQVIVEPDGNHILEIEQVGFCDPFGGCGPVVIFMTPENGENFSLYGAEFDVFGSGPMLSNLIGVTEGGGAATGPIGTGDWLNLQQVQFDAFTTGIPGNPAVITIQLDNISVNIVPIPAAAWLFGSALGVLGWLRRRRISCN